jgi:cytochrome oxidase assembly protein ShyY1
VRTAFEAAGGRVFVNRYGYLSDEKIDAIGRATGHLT